VDRFGLVADHSHRRGSRDAGALEIADRRSAEIVRNPVDADSFAGRTPCAVVGANFAAVVLL
jgi:hypothetical protein